MAIPFDAPEPTQKIAFDDSGNEIPLPLSVAAQAPKVDMAFGLDTPGIETIKNSLSSGDEKGLRASLKANVDAKDTALRTQVIQQIAGMRQGPLSNEEMDVIYGLRPDPLGRNLDTIIEQEYGKQYITKVMQHSKAMEPTIQALEKVAADGVYELADMMSDTVAQQEVVNNISHKYEKKFQDYSWVPFLGNFALDFIPGHSTYSSHQFLSTISDSFLPGNTVSDKLRYIHSLGSDELHRVLSAEMEKQYARNPNEAMRFLRAIQQYTSSDQFMDNGFAIVDASILGKPLGGLARALVRRAGKAGRGVADAERAIVDAERGAGEGSDKYVNQGELFTDKELAKGERPQTQLDLPLRGGSGEKQGDFGFGDSVRTDGIPPLMTEQKRPIIERGPGGRFLKAPQGKFDFSEPPGTVYSKQDDLFPESHRWFNLGEEPPAPTPGKPKPFRDERGRIRPEPKQTEFDFARGFREPGDSSVPRWTSQGELIQKQYSLPMDMPETSRQLVSQRLEYEMQVARALSDAGKGNAGKEGDLVRVLSNTGDVKAAGVISAAKEAANLSEGKPAVGNFMERVQSALNPLGRVLGSRVLSSEAAKRVSLGLQDSARLLGRVLEETPLVRRLPDEALITGMKETEEKIKGHYTKVHDSILDIEWNVGRHPKDLGKVQAAAGKAKVISGNVENVNSVSFILGTTDGAEFKTKYGAMFAGNLQYRLGKDAFTVEQRGGGYIIRISKPVDETSALLRNQLYQTETSTPRTLTNMFLGAFRSSEYTTSELNSQSRHLVTHGVQDMQAYLKEAVKPIQALKGTVSKDEYKELARFFELDRDWQGLGKKPGRFLDTAGEFEQEFLNVFKHLPSEKQIHAYFAHRQVLDFDYMSRNLGFYRDLNRLGVEDFRFRHNLPDSEANFFTEYFRARQRTSLPLDAGSYSAGVYIFDSSTKKGRYYRSGSLTDQMRAEITRKVAEDGYKVLEIADPLSRPLSGITKDYVNFVVVRDVNSRGLPREMIPYAPGGHREYASTHFVKLPSVVEAAGRLNHEGDITLLGQYTAAEAEKYAGRLEQARKLFNAKDAGFEEYVLKNLPEDWNAEYLSRKWNSGEWHPQAPFKVTESGKSVMDMHGDEIKRLFPNLHNEADSPYNLMAQVDKKFTGSRDPELKTIKEKGSESYPLLQLEAAPLIDPLRSLNRTVSNAVHQRLISDYKWQSVETFAAEFGHLFTVSKDTFFNNPLYWLQHGSLINTTSAAQDIAAAKNARWAIQNFLGMDSVDVRGIRYLQQKLLDTTFEKFGQKTSDYLSEHMLATTTDPFKYARNLAFHEKLGLFNPVQLVNQMQTLTHIVSVAGLRDGMKGLAGASLVNMARLTEDVAVLDHFAGIATKFGWTKQEWKDMREHARAFMRVQGETSWRDDVGDPKMIQTGWGKFLDYGTIFFTEGERMSRLGAWATAFAEHTRKNPGMAINPQTYQEVLARANLLNLDMTRASMAPIQQGLGGVVTQFGTYQARMVEQLWGNRLTKAEKARALFGQAAMYGVPAAIGAPIGVWPMYDSMRQSMLERGKDWDKSNEKAIMEGLPALFLELATGKQYNVGERLGAQGNPLFRDILNGDKGFGDFFLGASGSTMKDIAKAMQPIVYGIGSALTGNNDKFPILFDDLMGVARVTSSVNTAYKAVYAWNYHKYITKSGMNIANADEVDALMMTAFGLTRRDVADSFRLMSSSKTVKEAQDKLRPRIEEEVMKALQASGRNEEATARAHLSRAQQYFIMGDFRNEEAFKMFVGPEGSFRDLLDKTRFDFFINRSPQSQRQDRFNAFGAK